MNTLQRAQQRSVEWSEPNVGLTNPIEVSTTLSGGGPWIVSCTQITVVLQDVSSNHFCNSIFSQEPAVHTSLDDAFATMMQFMTVSTRKCKVHLME